MATFKVSKPTNQQIVHDVERVVGVFLVAAYSTWTLNGHQLNRAAVISATVAGATAVYGLVKSSLTTL